MAAARDEERDQRGNREALLRGRPSEQSLRHTVLMGPDNGRVKGVGTAALGEPEAADFQFAASNEMMGAVRHLKLAGTP